MGAFTRRKIQNLFGRGPRDHEEAMTDPKELLREAQEIVNAFEPLIRGDARLWVAWDQKIVPFLKNTEAYLAEPQPSIKWRDCKDCPYEVGDKSERDCAFPDCVGGWQAYAEHLEEQLMIIPATPKQPSAEEVREACQKIADEAAAYWRNELNGAVGVTRNIAIQREREAQGISLEIGGLDLTKIGEKK
jgi:hypothetical protein